MEHSHLVDYEGNTALCSCRSWNCKLVLMCVLFIVHTGDSACFEFLAVTRHFSSTSLVLVLFQASTIFILWFVVSIRELVDSLCRDGADVQYMQYLCKNCTTYHKCAKSLFKRPAFLFECFCDQQDSYSCPKAMRKTVKRKSVW